MKKSKGILAITVILALAITGCGTDNSGVVEKKAETTAKVTDNQETESQKADQEKATEKTTIAGISEVGAIEVVTAEKAEENTTTEESNTENAIDNSAVASNENTPSRNNNSNTPSGSGNSNTSSGGTSSGGSSSGGSSGGSSSNNSSNNPTPTPAPAPAQHQHTWVHVDATGHYETVVVQAAWDETVPVYGNVAHEICNDCGADLTNLSEDNLWDHIFGHADNGGKGSFRTEWRNEQTGTKIIHHDAVTEQRWVQDAPAYDVCSGCGATK